MKSFVFRVSRKSSNCPKQWLCWLSRLQVAPRYMNSKCIFSSTEIYWWQCNHWKSATHNANFWKITLFSNDYHRTSFHSTISNTPTVKKTFLFSLNIRVISTSSASFVKKHNVVRTWISVCHCSFPNPDTWENSKPENDFWHGNHSGNVIHLPVTWYNGFYDTVWKLSFYTWTETGLGFFVLVLDRSFLWSQFRLVWILYWCHSVRNLGTSISDWMNKMFDEMEVRPC